MPTYLEKNFPGAQQAVEDQFSQAIHQLASGEDSIQQVAKLQQLENLCATYAYKLSRWSFEQALGLFLVENDPDQLEEILKSCGGQALFWKEALWAYLYNNQHAWETVFLKLQACGGSRTGKRKHCWNLLHTQVLDWIERWDSFSSWARETGETHPHTIEQVERYLAFKELETAWVGYSSHDKD